MPLQQPVGHEVASHTHVLLEHRCPTAQVAPVPHRQVPLPQLFARVESQVLQAAPPWPQALTSGAATQVVPEQQPVGQVVESHTQLPLTQCKLEPQPAWVPQRQLPVLQLSAFVVSQVVQLAPLTPHCEVVGGVTQLVPAQQPVEQDEESQTHALFEHRWPTLHAAPVPHRQEPLPQLFARKVLQAVHDAPLVPHCVVVAGVTQVAPAQQPVAQVVESHTQALFRHR